MALADELDDLFSTPKGSDDESLSTDGVEELFAPVQDESLEVGPADVLFPAEKADPDQLTLPSPATDAAAAADAEATPMNDLLASLATDLQKLANDIHQLLADDDKA